MNIGRERETLDWARLGPGQTWACNFLRNQGPQHNLGAIPEPNAGAVA